MAVGTAADMMVQPYGALLIGSVAGILSVIGFSIITVGPEWRRGGGRREEMTESGEGGKAMMVAEERHGIS